EENASSIRKGSMRYCRCCPRARRSRTPAPSWVGWAGRIRATARRDMSEPDVVLFQHLFRAVAGAHQRAGDDLAEALGQAQVAVGAELLGRDEAAHRQVIGRGPHVLAEGQDV